MDTGNDPAEFTAENIANFKRQINALDSLTTGTVKSTQQIQTSLQVDSMDLHQAFMKKAWPMKQRYQQTAEELGISYRQ